MARPNETRARPGVVVLALLAIVLACGGTVHEWRSLWLARRAAVSRAIWPLPDGASDRSACAPFDTLHGWGGALADHRAGAPTFEVWWRSGASFDELPSIRGDAWQTIDPGAPLLSGECHRFTRLGLDARLAAASLQASRSVGADECLATTVRAISLVRVPAGPEDLSALSDRARALELLVREALRCAEHSSPNARADAARISSLLAARRGSLADTLQSLGSEAALALLGNIDAALRPGLRHLTSARPLYALHRYASIRALLRSPPPRELCARLDDAACTRALRRVAWPRTLERDALVYAAQAEGARVRLERLARDLAPPRIEPSR